MSTPRLVRSCGRTLALLLALLATPLLAVAEDAPKRYAFLVGINEYDHPNLPPLGGAENDAGKLAAILREHGYEVVVLTGELGKMDADLVPTRANIEAQFRKLLDRTKKGDLVLVALSGHGYDPQVEGESSYFCPQDARPFPKRLDTMISVKWLYERLKESFASDRVLLIDACRDDPNKPRRARGLAASDAVKPPPGMVALFSCKAGESSYEHPSQPHGLFFYHVLEALRADRPDDLTPFNLADQVSRRVAPDITAMFRNANVKQTPQLLFSQATGAVLLPARSTFTPRLTFEPAAYLRAWRELGSDRVYLEKTAPGRVAAMKELAHRGDAVGQLAYGRCLLFGVGVEKDEAEGARWLTKAAEQGQAVAQVALAHCYQLGRGVGQDKEHAATWLGKAAAEGYAPARLALADCYDRGRGVGRDVPRALELIRDAARTDVRAQFLLGQLYYYGHKVRKDRAEAARWFERARSGSTPLAAYFRGQCYQHSYGVAEDYTRAFASFQEAAEAGVVEAVSAVGVCHDNGIGTPDNPFEAFRWFRRTAGYDLASGMLNMSIHYTTGKSGQRDSEEAKRWLVKAADHDLTGAMRNLGWMAQTGVGGPVDYAEARRWYERAAALYDPAAMVNLGNLYRMGWGVTASTSKAREWYEKAIAEGTGTGCIQLGLMYEDGDFGTPDKAQAVELYRRGADLDDGPCQNRLGECHEKGTVVVKDLDEAFRWFEKSAKNGFPPAMFNLGYAYRTGRGTPRDDKAGFEWYLRGARAGDANCQRSAGICYLNGRGTTVDRDKGLFWLRQAAAQGHKDAIEDLKESR